MGFVGLSHMGRTAEHVLVLVGLSHMGKTVEHILRFFAGPISHGQNYRTCSKFSGPLTRAVYLKEL